MKTPILSRIIPLPILAAALLGMASSLPAADSSNSLSIEATSPIAEESSFPFRRLPRRGLFTITRTGPADTALRFFVLYSGTATAGVDYPALPWLVSIPAGTNRVEIEVVPTADDRAEPIEIIEAQLSQCPPVTVPPLGIPCFQVNIDPARSSARVFIRDDGITTASLELTAPREGAEFAVGESIAIAATAIDLDGAITRMDFFDADTKIGESEIVFIRQPDPGTPIYHEFVWTGASAGAHALTARALEAHGNAVTSPPVHLIVGASLPVVSIVAPDALAREGANSNAPADTATFLVTRSGLTNDALAVRFSVSGTASNGVDYAALASPLLIPAGARRAPLVIRPVNDLRAEAIETVVVTLLAADSLPAAYALGLPRRAAALIIDPDRPRPPCLRLPDGLFNVCVVGETNDCVRVEATRDFHGWTPLCIVPVNQGVAHFVDPDAPGIRNRFYRLVPVPCEP